MTAMQRSAKIALIAVACVLVFGGAGFYWFFLKSDAPPEVRLSDLTGGTAAPATGSTGETPEHTWKVLQDSKVFVGYRMQELFARDTVKKEAVGRTSRVTGTMKVDGRQVTAIEITADTTSLKSNESIRDNVIKEKGLETSRFSTATFKATAPIQLPSAPKRDETITASVTGELTLHGVTRTVTVPLEAVWTGPTIAVKGSVEIVLADYQIDRISTPIVTIDEKGTLEIGLLFGPG